MSLETELLNSVKDSLPFQNLKQEQQIVLNKVLPMLLEGLPKLLKTIEQNQHEIDGNIPGSRPRNEIVPIDAVQWMGEYLFRNNPNYANSFSTEGKKSSVR